jgi:hypothetical protein
MQAVRTQAPASVEPRTGPRPTGQDQSATTGILSAVAAAVLAGLIGGAIWGVIVVATGYEIGYVAWGIGLFAGYAVMHFSGGKQGLAFQTIAVAGSLVGIVAGKYGHFFYLYKEAVESKQGPEVAAQISIHSGETMQLFVENLYVMLSGYDLLWVALAVVTAWSIPKRLGTKLVT